MALPEAWYVLYSNLEEFNVIKNHYSKTWQYVKSKECGYCNINIHNNWYSDKTVQDFMKYNLIEISFDDFRRYVLKDNMPPLPKDDYKYLVKLLKKLKIK
jgi:hypothetical protein